MGMGNRGPDAFKSHFTSSVISISAFCVPVLDWAKWRIILASKYWHSHCTSAAHWWSHSRQPNWILIRRRLRSRVPRDGPVVMHRPYCAGESRLNRRRFLIGYLIRLFSVMPPFDVRVDPWMNKECENKVFHWAFQLKNRLERVSAYSTPLKCSGGTKNELFSG